jgi:hypothetical protein
MSGESGSSEIPFSDANYNEFKEETKKMICGLNCDPITDSKYYEEAQLLQQEYKGKFGKDEIITALSPQFTR